MSYGGSGPTFTLTMLKPTNFLIKTPILKKLGVNRYKKKGVWIFSVNQRPGEEHFLSILNVDDL